MARENKAPRPLWQKILWLGLAYLAATAVSRFVSNPASQYISVWLPAGIYVAGLLLADTRDWPALIIAASVIDIGSDFQKGATVALSLLICLANSVQAVTGAYLFRRFVARTTQLATIREFLGFLGYALVVSVMLGATLGAAIVVGYGFNPSYMNSWSRWWIANAMAIMFVAPFILTWFSRCEVKLRWWREPRRLAEAVLVLAGMSAAAWRVLVHGQGVMDPDRAVFFVFILWSALRFGVRGATAANLLFALLLTYLTSHYLKGLSPAQVSSGSYIPSMQMFLGVYALVGLVPAIVVAERDTLLNQLGHSEERFRTLGQASHEGVFITENGRVFDCNDQALKLLGFERAELIGRPVVDFISPESRSLVATTIAADREMSYEHRMVRKNGEVFDVEAQAKVLRFGDRKIRMTAVRDVTERKRAEAAVRDSEERYRNLTEASPESIIVHRDGVIIYANPAAVRMHGAKSTQELIGRPMFNLVQPEFHEMALVRRRSIAEHGTGGPMVEMGYLRLDGTPIQVELQSVRVLFNGVPATQITSHDITERSQAEQERQQFERKLQDAQKLESLGVLAGGIAHDFNNILTGIMGNASMASLDLASSSPVQDYLTAIKEGSRRAAELCRQMLAYSGKGRFVVQNLSLNRLVEETTHLLQISISKKAVLRFNLYKGLPAVMADATQIRQVIMNLVINASEAIGEKSGVISLSTGLTRVDHAYLGGTVHAPEIPEGDYVYLEVSDSGCGMSPETQARIFDPFFTTKFAGRGLGLAAVLGIVRGHKGALKIHSELGHGTTFKLLFPCVAGTEEPVETGSPAVSSWRGEGCVLVVDDEESVRTAASIILRKLGFSVALASDGRQGLEAFRAEPDRFTLVLMDLTMPHMDGESAFTELRRIRDQVRVVLMSGFNEQEAISRFTGKGLASFLQKPFGFEELSSTLRGVLDRAAELK